MRESEQVRIFVLSISPVNKTLNTMPEETAARAVAGSKAIARGFALLFGVATLALVVVQVHALIDGRSSVTKTLGHLLLLPAAAGFLMYGLRGARSRLTESFDEPVGVKDLAKDAARDYVGMQKKNE